MLTPDATNIKSSMMSQHLLEKAAQNLSGVLGIPTMSYKSDGEERD